MGLFNRDRVSVEGSLGSVSVDETKRKEVRGGILVRRTSRSRGRVDVGSGVKYMGPGV